MRKYIDIFFFFIDVLAEKMSDGSLDRLCNSVVNFANVESEKLQAWFRHVILGATNVPASTSAINIATPTAGGAANAYEFMFQF